MNETYRILCSVIDKSTMQLVLKAFTTSLYMQKTKNTWKCYDPETNTIKLWYPGLTVIFCPDGDILVWRWYPALTVISCPDGDILAWRWYPGLTVISCPDGDILPWLWYPALTVIKLWVRVLYSYWEKNNQKVTYEKYSVQIWRFWSTNTTLLWLRDQIQGRLFIVFTN
jgi:hypothetical protein